MKKTQIIIDAEVYSSGKAVRALLEAYAKKHKTKTVEQLIELFGNPHNILFADAKKAKSEISGRLRYNQEPIIVNNKKVYVSNQITTEYALSIIKILKDDIKHTIKVSKV